MYNVMSKKAEEFIDHEEIEECLAYALWGNGSFKYSL